MDKTGRTQGMPLRINPPNKAIIIIIKKEDIGYFETFDFSTSRGAVNKKLRLLSVITNCASNFLAFINFLLKIVKMNPNQKDRWNRSPHDEAKLLNNDNILKLFIK